MHRRSGDLSGLNRHGTSPAVKERLQAIMKIEKQLSIDREKQANEARSLEGSSKPLRKGKKSRTTLEGDLVDFPLNRDSKANLGPVIKNEIELLTSQSPMRESFIDRQSKRSVVEELLADPAASTIPRESARRSSPLKPKPN